MRGVCVFLALVAIAFSMLFGLTADTANATGYEQAQVVELIPVQAVQKVQAVQVQRVQAVRLQSVHEPQQAIILRQRANVGCAVGSQCDLQSRSRSIQFARSLDRRPVIERSRVVIRR